MISIKNISFAYGKHRVLDDVSFDVAPGEFVSILGENGAGKSTLITCLNKIRTPKKGRVFIEGKDVLTMNRRETARHISYVAQKNEIHQMTVFDSVLLGRKPYIQWALSQEDITLCEEVLEIMDLTPFKLRYIDELSGGELQKVMLARALVQQPRLLLLDEPTSNLDPKNQYEMMGLVRRITKERNISTIVVSHDINLALRFCDKFLFLKEGRTYQYGDASVVTPKTIESVYGIPSCVGSINGWKTVVVG